ncbi:hypothetical protein [Carnobacterium sp. TMP28]|uniref:hypothetical protein n=1 Tax=Carnobacterium sp. TMP28 TaxID=3397060 RepID=UPI0039E1A027
MKQYDEYQKLMRYKYGYYSFISLISLIMLNYFLGLFPNLQWAATKELEIMIILFLVVLFFINISIYHHAYFRKIDNKNRISWLFLIMGLFSLYLTYRNFLNFPEELIVDGKVGSSAIRLFSGIFFLSVPITTFIRNKLDEKMEKKEC